MSKQESKHDLGRDFSWLNVTQFFGALNDNFFKQVLILALMQTGLSTAILAGTEVTDDLLSKILSDAISTSGIVFAIPFLLFLPASGVIADKFSKTTIIRFAKILEVVTMAIGFGALLCLPFAPQVTQIGLFVTLFLMCTQSTFFSPAKYGVLPEMVGNRHLGRANAYIQAFTYLAIIIGIVLASEVSRIARGTGTEGSNLQFPVLGATCLMFAFFGLIASRFTGNQPPAGTSEKISPIFFMDIWNTLKSIRHDKYLTGAVYASAFFLMVAAFLQGYIIVYGQTALFPPGDSMSASASIEKSLKVFLLAALGIGIGSLIAGKLSRHTIEFGVVPVGAAMITLGCLLLAAFKPGVILACIAMLIAGIGAGLFNVPIQAFIQQRSPRDRLGQVVAASAWVGWIGVILAYVIIGLFGAVGLPVRWGFFIIGLLTLVLSIGAFWWLPDFFFRFFTLVVTRIIYKVRCIGLENVPTDGPALMVCNHVSWIDPMVVVSTQQRRVRFLMSKIMLEKIWWMKLLGKLMNVIPVDKADSRAGILESIRVAREALDEGYVVCIFAEGHISRNGAMYSFKSGLERILKDSDIPVIPCYLGGAYGSITSYAYGSMFSRRPRELPYPVSLIYGKPMPPDSSAWEVRQKVMELSVDYYDDKKSRRKPITHSFIRCARRNAKRFAMTDTVTRRKLTYREVLAGTIALSPVLEPVIGDRQNIGVLLPPSIGGALANISLTFLRRVAVNLNPTSGVESFASAIAQCEMDTIITTRKLVEKFPDLPLTPNVVMIEDLMRGLSKGDKIRAGLKAMFMPANLLAPTTGFEADELLTVIFSSGSTGEPKGVMLSHHNILSNIEALSDLLMPGEQDCIVSALPFFHSFGYTVGVWFPMLAGFPAVHHISPLETSKIAKLISEYNATIYVATPTFLQSFLKRAEPEQLDSLVYCLVGAEKLKRKLADDFTEKFGVTPLEGYGATECSPVVTVNLPNVKLDGVKQTGHKPASVGQPIPGVAVRIVDPETHEELPCGESGLVLVKGPNVMLGYLDKPQLTAKVLKRGWYDTGDMAKFDKDGFLTITDRLSRFSKIAGEMVPHIGVEERMQELLGMSETVLTVTSVPDERKGEKLVVLYTPDAGDPETLQAMVKSCDLPNLWKPSKANYIPVDEIPVLGSGKLDLKAIKKFALDAKER